MLGITKLRSVSLKGLFVISVLLKISYMEGSSPDAISNTTVTDFTTSSVSITWSVPQKEVGAGPVVVGNLSVTQITTSSVSLRWSPSPENTTSYLAEWKEGTTCKNKSTKSSSIDITDLTPGTQYTFTVIPIFGDNLKGASVNCSQFTKPGQPENISAVNQQNNGLRVLWSSPPGTVMEYEVTVTNCENNFTRISTTQKNYTDLQELEAGVMYNLSVTSIIGPFKNTSDIVQVATRPNPPGAIKIVEKTNNSISLSWDVPVMEAAAEAKYSVAFTSSLNSSTQIMLVSQNQVKCSGLTSGTLYYISVGTVGPQDLRSPNVSRNEYTLPNAVQNLKVSTKSISSVMLEWESPVGAQSYFAYRVNINSNGSVRSQITSMNQTNITDLKPGTKYNCSVTTLVVNDTYGTPLFTFCQTKPEKAKNVTVIGTTTSLTMMWDRPEGTVTSYIIDIYNGSSLAASQTVFNNSAVFANLKPGTLYSVTLNTLSGPLQGEPQMINCSTYPNPPSFIKAEGATTSSINISWGRPSDMDGDQYTYIVSYQGNEIASNDTCFMLGNLTSGTHYNISVLTVGPMSYKSKPQTVLSCTRVSSVKKLQATEITTSNVTLVWESPNSGKSYEYFVATKSLTQVTNFTVNRTDASIRSLQSGSNYTFDVTVTLQGVCESAAESISLFTRPYPIVDLKSEAINESVVYLNWTRPQEYQDSYTYTVQISGCTSNTKNQSVQQEQAYIYDLIPGTNCFLLIYSRASNGIEGWPLSTSQYTKPEKVLPAVSNGHKNDSINVTWGPTRGNIEKYVVTLYNPQGPNSMQELNNTAQSYLFVNLKAGRMYTVTVRTSSGPFAEESLAVSVATYPNKPGDITIADKNTSSIALAWSSPLDSDGSTNYYMVKYQSAVYNHTIKTNTSSSVLNRLASGTSYNISVATVGPEELESAPVTVDLVTTRPEKVQSLEIQSVFLEEVMLKWSPPSDFKNGYYYGVITSRTDYVIKKTTPNKTYKAVDLLPGTEYNFSVMTLTLDGTESSHAMVSSCTDAAPVTNISCQGPDLTPALTVQWSSPKGLNKGFEINITDKPKETLPTCTSECVHTLKNLSYNTKYTVNILTRGCGNSSPITALSCKTGITVPLIPDIKGYIEVTDVEHDRFTLKLNPGLFSDSEGPIVSYGVLVTSSVSSIIGGNSSSFKKYLSNTYEAWNTGNEAAYLATLKGDKETYQGGITSIVIGDNTEWGTYINGPLKPKGSYRFAIVMFTRLEKNGEFIDISKSYVSISPFYETEINLPENPVVVTSIVMSIVSILLLISIFIIGAVSFKR
uniref:protein-tyrosine-phosphatase n=1 Tax=Paramormyrops kingsleyae TaxID=1676925 RepID=A0A3B3SXT2_9TELE